MTRISHNRRSPNNPRGPGRRGGGYRGASAPAWTPASLTNLRADWDLARGVTLDVTETDVDAVADQTGNGNHLVAAAAGNRPLYEAAGFGGQPSMLLDGAAEWMRKTSFSWGAAVSAYTVVIIGTAVTTTNGDIPWAYGASNEPRTEHTVGAKNRHRGPGAVIADSTSNATVAGVWTWTWTGAAQSAYRGTTLEAGPTANANAAPADGGTFSIGASVSGSACANIRVARALVMRAAITADERTALAAYAARYGL